MLKHVSGRVTKKDSGVLKHVLGSVTKKDSGVLKQVSGPVTKKDYGALKRCNNINSRNMCANLNILMECYCLFLNVLCGDMASKSKEKRKRVVQFQNRVMTTRADWMEYTADHFMAEGVP